MLNAYFVKAENTFRQLKQSVEIAKNNKASPLNYHLVGRIEMDSQDYLAFISNMMVPNKHIIKYSSQLIPDEAGIWNCVIICSEIDSNNIIVYTAGRTQPLYSSII
jgi:hypothetical protein